MGEQSAFVVFHDTGDPRPMLKWLRKARAVAKRLDREAGRKEASK